jgi:PAS domain S-box-containing protein
LEIGIEGIKHPQKNHPSGILRTAISKYFVSALVLIMIFTGLYILSRFNYPLFHSVVDMGTVFIAASVFVVVWNSRHLLDNYYYLFIGIAFIFFAFLDFMHLLGNKNMGVFPQFGNLGPTLYIASRYVLSISFMVAPFFIRRRLNVAGAFLTYSVVTILIMLSIFYWQIFPITYIEGVGLTRFKIISDYIICLILSGAIGLLFINRRSFDPKVLRTIIYSIILSITTGLAFTLYTDPFGITNAIGHFLQIASFFLVYRVFVETVLTKPQDILYRNLKQSKEEVLRLNIELEKVNLDLKKDIIEHKKAEEALQESEKKYKSIVETANEGILIGAPDGKIVFANQKMADLLGYPLSEIIGVEGLKFMDMNQKEKVYQTRKELETGILMQKEFKFSRKDGTTLWTLASISPQFDNTGKHIANLAMHTDITERKNGEEALKINNERLTILSEANSLLLSNEDPEKIVQTIANKVMIHLNCDCFFNFIADENAGKLRLNAYAGIPEETAMGIAWLNYGEAICGCAARDGCPIVSENIQQNGDMRAALVRSFGVQAYAAHPLIVGLKTIGTLSFGTRSRIAFTGDETALMKTIAGQVSIAMERKLNGENLKRYAIDLESANKDLESFSYSVSHDLRAPLRRLDGFSQALMEDYSDKFDEQGRQWLVNIQTSSQHMGHLIDTILRLSRVTRIELKFEKINLSQIACSLAARLKETEPGRQVNFNIMSGVEAIGDSNLLELALQNLLGNAFKFTKERQPAYIEFGFTQQEGKKIYFVKDNGVGFDMKYADKLFMPFQRLHNSNEFPGTGIGLATIQRIIHKHGGKVWAEGVVNQGATFYFTLE